LARAILEGRTSSTDGNDVVVRVDAVCVQNAVAVATLVPLPRLRLSE